MRILILTENVQAKGDESVKANQCDREFLRMRKEWLLHLAGKHLLVVSAKALSVEVEIGDGQEIPSV